jgi:hypothetical protein
MIVNDGKLERLHLKSGEFFDGNSPNVEKERGAAVPVKAFIGDLIQIHHSSFSFSFLPTMPLQIRRQPAFGNRKVMPTEEQGQGQELIFS